MRNKGEGNIRQREDGRWVARLELPAVEGKRRRVDLYGKTKRDVLDKLDEARRDRRDGIAPAPKRGSVTVGELTEEWLASISRPHSKLRELTQDRYRSAARTRILPFLGKIAIDKLDDVRIERWQNALLEHFAPRTVLKARVVLGAVIRLARRRHLLRSNPLELVEAPGTSAPNKRVLSGAEAGRLLQAITGHRLETAFLAHFLTGVRTGELLGWAWADVDLDAGTVRIRQQLQRIPQRHVLELVQPKTAAGVRLLPIPRLLVERLQAQRAAHPETELVFTMPSGKPIAPRFYNAQFRKMADDAGLTGLVPHELRHSAATILQILGVPAMLVAQYLGHADPSVTLRWYSHTVPEPMRDVAARMDDYARRILEEHPGERSSVKPVSQSVEKPRSPRVEASQTPDAASLSQS